MGCIKEGAARSKRFVLCRTWKGQLDVTLEFFCFYLWETKSQGNIHPKALLFKRCLFRSYCLFTSAPRGGASMEQLS